MVEEWRGGAQNEGNWCGVALARLLHSRILEDKMGSFVRATGAVTSTGLHFYVLGVTFITFIRYCRHS